jgi:regulator of sigma E protease
MNAILPIVIFTAVFMIPEDVELGQVSVLQVIEGSAAAEAQVQAGDVLISANGQRIENGNELVKEIQLNGGSQMALLIERDGRDQLLSLRPQFETGTGAWKIGVQSELDVSRIESRSDSIWEAIPNGFVSSWETVVLFKQAIGGYISSGSSPELSGPIGIAQITGEVTRSTGLTGWLSIGILLSINLAILNILPIPMLDGGRMAFVAIELFRRGKRVPPEKEGLVHLIGFAVLLGGILIISANDIQRLIDGRSFLGG